MANLFSSRITYKRLFPVSDSAEGGCILKTGGTLNSKPLVPAFFRLHLSTQVELVALAGGYPG